MKKIFILSLIFLSFSCNEQNNNSLTNFKVSGFMKNVPENTFVKLFYRDKNNTVYFDSTLIVDSKFELKGKADFLNFYGIEFSGNNYIIYILADSSDNIEINADFNELQNYKIKNSKHSEFIQMLENQLFLTNNKLTEALRTKKDFGAIVDSQRIFSQSLITSIDTSPAVIIAFSQKMINGEKVLPIELFYNLFKKAQKNLYEKYSSADYYNIFTKFIKNFEIQQNRQNDTINYTKPEKLANFTSITTDGKQFELSSLKGNWILLNFWATWSLSSGINNKVIKQISEKYPKLKIVQISLDNQKNIANDTLQKYGFKHFLIIDTLVWSSKLVNLYAVNAVPTYVLINPASKIVLYSNNSAELLTQVNNLIK